LDAALMTINQRARILMCGQIAIYNDSVPSPGPKNLWQLLVKSARMEGYLVSSYLDRWPEGRKQLAEWLNAGLIKFKEHIDRGLENAPQSMLRLFNGHHDGKLIIDIAGSEA
jgi:NADPH-dependent curcumin reductase